MASEKRRKANFFSRTFWGRVLDEVSSELNFEIRIEIFSIGVLTKQKMMSEMWSWPSS